jgi:hypothetical protein
MFTATRYNGRPAVYDKLARVFYFARSMVAAQKRARALNAGE